MTAATIARAAKDPDLIDRVLALANKEIVYSDALANSAYGKQLASGMMNAQPLMWPIAVDTEAAYETAVNSGRGAPGHDVDIITDASITSAVIAHWPYTADEQTARAGTVTVTVNDLTVTLVVADGLAGGTYDVTWGDGYADSPVLDGDGSATAVHLYVAGMWTITVEAPNGVVFPPYSVTAIDPEPEE